MDGLYEGVCEFGAKGDTFAEGELRDLVIAADIGPRLCGNCSGLGRKCVLSNRPHLLQRTLPGVRLDRRQVDVSVVRQL